MIPSLSAKVSESLWRGIVLFLRILVCVLLKRLLMGEISFGRGNAPAFWQSCIFTMLQRPCIDYLPVDSPVKILPVTKASWPALSTYVAGAGVRETHGHSQFYLSGGRPSGPWQDPADPPRGLLSSTSTSFQLTLEQLLQHSSFYFIEDIYLSAHQVHDVTRL